MTENLLQYIWNFKIFKRFDFEDIEGNPIEILDFGEWNHNAGPDFLYAKIKIGNLTLVGNIELHLKTSDFIAHKHNKSYDYQNIILHAVYHHDADLDFFIENNIATLELKNHIDNATITKYEQLLQKTEFIPCEKIFSSNDIPFQFFEQTLLEKLNEKSIKIEQSLKLYKNDYEAVLFHYLAYAFGLKVNASIFQQMAESIDFSVIRKVSQNEDQLQSLFFGIAGWLENPQDETTKKWKIEYDFLVKKFQLPDLIFPPKFLRLRPSSFPTIRLAQLANLYYKTQNLFSKIIQSKNIDEIIQLFSSVKASEYWDKHYTFGKKSTQNHAKTLSKDFIEILVLNATLPMRYTYFKHHKEEAVEEILEFYRQILPEKNKIIAEWKKLGLNAKTALESQAVLYHYKNFCIQKKCLNCNIGYRLLKK